MQDYIEQRSGGFYVAGTRISLDSVVFAFNSGAAPESILQAFEGLGSLENVYGAVTYYLSHKPEVDEYLSSRDQAFEAAREGQTLPAGLKDRFDSIRAGLRPSGR